MVFKSMNERIDSLGAGTEDRKVVFSILVENNSGVLSHVSGLFSRRGYNIHSFSAGVTADHRLTRMTIVCSGDEQILEQIEKQLSKLEDVLFIKKLESHESVCRELILVKVSANERTRQSIISVADIFRANVIDVTKESLIIELTGTTDKLDAFIDMLSDYQILELARTGITGLSRGAADIQDAEKLLNRTYD